MRIVMIGATGAVGSRTAKRLETMPQVESMALLGRRLLDSVSSDRIEQHIVDVLEPMSYDHLMIEYDVAICTLGVGQPSTVSKKDFLRIDKTAVLDFADQCKRCGVRHFQLLSSVGQNAASRSFYLRSKGELVDDIASMGFERFSVFTPSTIVTPSNRYGISQAVVLKVSPYIDRLLHGRLRKFRSIEVADLGYSIANNVLEEGSGVEILEWDDFKRIGRVADQNRHAG